MAPFRPPPPVATAAAHRVAGVVLLLFFAAAASGCSYLEMVQRHRRLRQEAAGQPAYLSMFVSLSTPYGGHDAARAGIQRAPEAIPSWYDLAPDSPFLRALTASPLPTDLPFFLLFGYRNPGRVLGANSDGVVTIRSELELSAQLQATRSYGFDASHTGILASADVRGLFNQLLAPAAPSSGVLDESLGSVKHEDVNTRPPP